MEALSSEFRVVMWNEILKMVRVSYASTTLLFYPFYNAQDIQIADCQLFNIPHVFF